MEPRKRSQALRCALCHDSLDGEEALECLDCFTWGHRDCLEAEGDCPTLGCSANHAPKLANHHPRGWLGKLSGNDALVDSLTLETAEQVFQRRQIAEQRYFRQRRLQRLLSFLHLSLDDVINHRSAKRRVYSFFKVQRASQRREESRHKDVEADYDRWLKDQL